MEKLFVIAGTNASGKSGLGIELAKNNDAEIISADSRQIFKGLNLGSGKVTQDEMQGVPHHMLDVAEVNEFYPMPKFQQMAYEKIDEVISRGRLPILVGGTGLYINAIVDGYNIQEEKVDLELRDKLRALSKEELINQLKERSPQALEGLDINNKQRIVRALERVMSGVTKKPNTPRYETCIIGVTWPREVLYERIRERLDRRLEQGMIDEVKNLREAGATDDFLYRLGLEYRYILMYLRGEFKDYQSFYDKLFMEIRHLAKEQMTWFRKREDMHWIDMTKDPMQEAQSILNQFFK